MNRNSGKDQVIKCEAVPLWVMELAGKPHEPSPAGQFGGCLGDGLAADDPEHVEAAARHLDLNKLRLLVESWWQSRHCPRC